MLAGLDMVATYSDNLCADLFLSIYKPELPIIVAADASNEVLGACMLHKLPDGKIKAVFHAS